MKILKTILLAIVVTVSFTANAQIVDEIAKNYIEAIGGAEALNKINNIKMVGEVNAQGMVIPVETVITKDGKMYVKIEFQGQKIKQLICDGKSAWGYNMMAMTMEKMPNDVAKVLIDEFKDFPNAFINYKERGYKLELVDTVTEEGVECYKVKLTKKPVVIDGQESPNITFYYFDTETFVPIVFEREINEGPAKGQMMKSPMSDYQEVDGVYFPFSTTEMGMPITYKTIETNVAVDDSEFTHEEKAKTPEAEKEENKN